MKLAIVIVTLLAVQYSTAQVTVEFAETSVTASVNSTVTVNVTASLQDMQTWPNTTVSAVCTAKDGTAIMGEDFRMTDKNITFTNETRTKICSVEILQNATCTRGRIFYLQLEPTQSNVTVTIGSDAGGPCTGPPKITTATGLTPGEIAGITIGILVAIVAIIALSTLILILLVKKRQAK